MIYCVTTNKGKFNSMHEALKEYDIEVEQVELDLPESRSYDIREIARQKVEFAYSKIGKPCIAMDAGFFVNSLNGFPRTYVNFALETLGVDGILKLVEGTDRKCAFRHCLAFYDGIDLEYFESVVSGMLVQAKMGELDEKSWSELALVFKPDGSDKTLAQMTQEEYMKWKESHRRESEAVLFAEYYSLVSKK